MAQMQALLKIKADVEGEGKINALGRAIGGLSSTAGKVSGGLRGLAGAAGGLSNALGSLVPLATGAGLMALAKGAIDTADNLRDMSIRTGVSVEQLSKLKTAAEMSGATIDDVGKALAKTAIAIGNSTSAASNAMASSVAGRTTQLKMSIADQARLLEQSEARKVNLIKSGAERQIQVVRDGEQRQVEAIERAKDQRIAVLERESDQRMREINRRYQQEEKLLNDSFDDQLDAERRKTDESLNQQEREIDRRYDLRQREIQNSKTLSADAKDAAVQSLRDQQDAELTTLRNGYADYAKEQSRIYRDRQEAAQQAIDDRRAAEQEAEQAATQARKKQAEESANAEKAITAKASAERIAQIKTAAAAQVKAVQDGNAQAQDAYAKLGIALRNTDGSQRGAGEVFMDVFDALNKLPTASDRAAAAFDLYGGKVATKLLPLFAMTRDEVEKLVPVFTTDFANAADNLNDNAVTMSASMERLGVVVAKVLLPVTNMLEGFTKLPGPLQSIIGGAVIFTAALVLLAPAITAVISLVKGLAALKIFATIAGWAGVLKGLAPIFFGLKTAFLIAFKGILAWLGSTFIPAIAAFFSGPAGWTVLAVAAVVAMAIAFREPIGKFFIWLGEAIPQAFSGLIGLLQPIFVQPFIDLWNNVLRGPVTAMFDWIGGYVKASMQNALSLAYAVFVKPWADLWNVLLREPVTAGIKWVQDAWQGITNFFNDAVVTPISKAWTALTQLLPVAMKKTAEFVNSVWTGIVNNVKNVFRSLLSFIVNGINTGVKAINYLIDGFNRIPNLADIPRLGTLSIPAFAEGGVVDRPTLALVGDGGEREFIIPESKMAAASANFLNGARGGAVIPQSSSNGSTGNAQINVTTGPVLQQGGQQYVTMADLEKAMRKTADGVYASLRTPAGRYAVGTR